MLVVVNVKKLSSEMDSSSIVCLIFLSLGEVVVAVFGEGTVLECIVRVVVGG